MKNLEIMKTSHELMSLKKYNANSIEKRINTVEERIKEDLPFVFTDSVIAENVGQDLIFLSKLKSARLLMDSVPYKLYEETGKHISYEDFLTEYHKSL